MARNNFVGTSLNMYSDNNKKSSFKKYCECLDDERDNQNMQSNMTCNHCYQPKEASVTPNGNRQKFIPMRARSNVKTRNVISFKKTLETSFNNVSNL